MALIKIDNINWWNLVSDTDEYGDMRRYYLAAAPHRALIVCRNGLSLADMRGRTVDGQIGNDVGFIGLSRCPGEGQSKITIYRLARGFPMLKLSRILQDSPQD